LENAGSLEEGVPDILVERDFQCLHRQRDEEDALSHRLA